MKEAFHVISKDPDENLSEKKQVELLLDGIKSTDTSIVAAETAVFKDYRNDLDKALSFLSGLISSIHGAAQSEYGSRHSGKRRYVSGMDSRDSRGRGRARRCGDGRGRGHNSMKKYMNGVDVVSDPHRNFTS